MAVLAAVIRRGNEIVELKNAEGSQNFAKISLGYSFLICLSKCSPPRATQDEAREVNPLLE